METGTGFVQSFQSAVEYASTLVWGPPMLILLVGTGIYLTVVLRGLQFSTLLPALHLAVKTKLNPPAVPA